MSIFAQEEETFLRSGPLLAPGDPVIAQGRAKSQTNGDSHPGEVVKPALEQFCYLFEVICINFDTLSSPDKFHQFIHQSDILLYHGLADKFYNLFGDIIPED